MRTFFLSLFSCLLLSVACGSSDSDSPPVEAPPAPVPAQPRLVRVLVVPFSDVSQKQLDYFSLGLALFANARLEELSYDAVAIKAAADAGIKLEAVAGAHVLPEESASLIRPRPDDISTDAIYAVAKKTDATYVLTGFYAGRVEKWMLGVVLFEVGPDGLKEVARTSDERKIYASAKDTPKPARPGVQLETVHAMLGGGIVKSFTTVGIALPEAHVKALSTPQTKDVVSFINLARAYRALQLGEGADALDVALARAEDAVRIWPDYQIARRLYAWLLWQTDSPEKARLHFQEALKRDPNDVRSLTALGRIEIGGGQFDAARLDLEAAALLRPGDSSVQYWLGTAYAKLGRIKEAIGGYESSRTLDPRNLDTRRALAGLYAAARRYSDAAIEFKAVVEGEPKNLETVYLLAACERAAGNLPGALAAYDLGLSRVPGDAKLRQLRQSAIDGVGAKLSSRIASTAATRDKMEILRQEFQGAVNDGVWSLTNDKKTACVVAGPDAVFAASTGKVYESEGRGLQVSVKTIREALKAGDRLMLTTDESAQAEDLLLYERKAIRDYREMRSGHDGTFKPLLERVGCKTDPAKVAAATIDEIRARNTKRLVTLPEPPKRDASGISPVVADNAVDNVSLYVQNSTRHEIVVVLDGKPLEPSVPPYREGDKLPQYSTPIGMHVVCHVSKGETPECIAPNLRRFMIENGTLYHIQ